MALIGNIEHFNGNSEEFETYLERVEHLFKVNVISEEMKVSMFITLVGSDVYKTLRNLAAPKKPTELTYAETIELLKKHYSPPVSEIYERFIFNKCNQKIDQTIAEYIVELRKLASTCDFKQFLDEALRDRFVCGIQLENIQKRLLSESKLTFSSACQVAQAAELAEKQVKSLADNGTSNVNFVQKFTKGSESRKGTRYHQQEELKVKSEGNTGQVSYGHCQKCGRNHPRGWCPAVKWRCYICSKFGHVAKLCTSKGSKAVGAVEEQEMDEAGCAEINSDLYNLNKVGVYATSPYRVLLKLGNKMVAFEVDTGACKSVMSFDRYKEILKLPLKPVSYKLNVVSGQDIKAIGECFVEVQYGGKKYQLTLTVIESNKDFVPLLGRNWLNVLFPNWQNNFCVDNQTVNHIYDADTMLNEFKGKYKNVFDLNLCSPIKVFEVKFCIKDNVTPIIKKAYSMPYALKPRVEKKIEQMITVGILKPVTNSEWASPIVVVPKKDGDIRICTDFRLTVNKVLNVDQYPLPKPDDIFASLAGGSIFTVLDLSGAYQQLKVHPDFQKYLTINTHVGLLQYTRLTYGISSAPAIFQSVIDQILCGIPRVNCYLDDILISGRSVQECQELVETVLERLNKYNVKVNLDKCKFFKKEVEYLGHRIDSEGIHPTVEKLRAINEAPEPQNITQLRAYLGLINYYGKFVPMLSSQLKALYRLLEKDVEFNFNKECREAFQVSKELIVKNQVLTHYDPDKIIVISCDSSSYGVGGVLSHRVNGIEKPVVFVSGTLSKAERNYSQLEREALAIIFSVKKFHKYIYELCNAATKIQASFRGHMTRKHEAEAKKTECSSSQDKMKQKTDEEEELDIDLSDPELNKAAVKIQASFRGHMVRKDNEGETTTAN